MGCDIHWYSEHRENGNWVCDQAGSFVIQKSEYEDDRDYPEMQDFPGRQRDYWFFGFLNSDVRSHWEYSFEGKGDIPDCSPEVQAKLDYWEQDAHSHSWLTRKELEDKLALLVKLKVELLIAPRDPLKLRVEHVAHHIDRLSKTIANLKAVWPEAAPEDQRIVFWFDN